MMENLTIQDPPHPQMQGGHGGPHQPGGGPGGMPPPNPLPGVLGRPPPGPQQLPAQMFTTAAQLLDLTDSESLLPKSCSPNLSPGSN